MKIKWDWKEKQFYIKEKYDGQTYFMAFQSDTNSKDTVADFNVYFCIYSKRKHVDDFENKIQETGKHPFYTIRWAKQAFNELEEYVVQDALYRYEKVIIHISWLDRRRRNVYAHILGPKGYTFQNFWGYKCLAKEFTNG